ncbi:hypothetical protein F5Y16DRAFT_154407 [Xylariaceae sp. FL0255]|nr:hypothetical protein F5Y16DRAFT_154407 [Xylariaceae sp. FL0255]
MTASRIFAAALGCIATLATMAITALEIVLAIGLWPSVSSARIVAVIASAIEAIVFVILSALLIAHFRRMMGAHVQDMRGVWFACQLLASVLATIASVVLLILIGKKASVPTEKVTISLADARIGTSVALGIAFTSQLFFVVVYFILHRLPDSDQALSLHTNEEGRLSPQVGMRVKSVPYTQTKAAVTQLKIMDQTIIGNPSRPGSISGRSVAETVNSDRSFMQSTIRPMGSKTKLLPRNSGSMRRGLSLDSNSYREQQSTISASSTQDGFDSWDTSSVDPHNRQMVLETSSPIRSRFLETIPASPTGSRSPSPGFPLDLEPPKRGRRGRSNSPAARSPRERIITPKSSETELNIHPLFRSDSPGPPPAATPGTVVIAAPSAGQFISNKTVTRMRSGSLPNPPSPLSRQGSYDSFRKSPSPNPDSLQPETIEERKMTPPIPEWILNAERKPSVTEFGNYRSTTPGKIS